MGGPVDAQRTTLFLKGNNKCQDSSRLQVHKHVNELAGGENGSSHKAVLELGKWID